MAALADSNRAAVKLEALQQAAHSRNIKLSIQRVASGEEIIGAIEEAHSRPYPHVADLSDLTFRLRRCALRF
jgi:hypothetical protein